MSMDLVISDTGEALIASNEPFPADISRIDFDLDRRSLTVCFDGKTPDLPLNLGVHDRLLSALMKAPAIVILHVCNNAPVSAFSVPLVQTGFSPE